MKLKFFKMEASKNTHAYIDTISEKVELPKDLSKLSKELSSPFTGVGTDGIVIISNSNVADIKMDIYNSDGSIAETCGNALRCVSKYVYENHIMKTEVFSIETLAGIVKAKIDKTTGFVTVDMGTPKKINRNVELLIDKTSLLLTEVSMGNPHAVIFVDDVEKALVHVTGPKLEKHQHFSEGTNVEFIKKISQKEINFRVWERGVGETMACGTGACASVVTMVLHGHSKKGEKVRVHMPGGSLEVSWNEDDHVYMTGPANLICDGYYSYNCPGE